MSDPITGLVIQIKADAAQAIAALKNVAMGVQNVEETAVAAAVPTANFGKALTDVGATAEATGGHIAGMSYYFRSFFDSMRFALMGNPLAAYYMVDEATRAMVASGLGLAPIAGIITGLGAAIGGSFFLWKELGNHMDKDAKEADKLAASILKIPEAVKLLYQAQKLGAITEEERKKYEGELSGSVPLLVTGGTAKNPTVGRNPFDMRFHGGKFNPLGISPFGPEVNAQNSPTLAAASAEKVANATQVLAFVQNKINAALIAHQKSVRENEVENADKAMTQKQQAEADRQKRDSLAGDRTKEQTLARLQRQRQEELRTITEQEQKQKAADKQHEEDLRRQAQLTRDVQRAALQDQIEAVKSNDLLSAREKLVIVTSLNEQQRQLNDSEISQLEKLKSQVETLSDQLMLEQKISELNHDNNRLALQTTPTQQDSFAFNWTAMLARQSDKWTSWAQESAGAFASAWQGATNGVSGGLTHLFEYGAQRGQWFREIWNGVIGSMISSVTHLAIQWVTQHVLMTAAQATAEQAMTGATAAGASERGTVRLAETVMHNTLVALRLAAHMAGELAATAITAVQAMARAIYHAIAAAIGAMESEASVPYVGVILGIAAAAAVMSAAYGMMGGFAAGGYTGDGHPSRVAGIVHAGEYVIPASRVQGARNLLAAIHSGALADISTPHISAGALAQPAAKPGSGTTQINTSHYIYTDKQKMARDIEKDDAHTKWVIDVVAKNSYKWQ